MPPEGVTVLLELLAQLGEIVDFAIVGDDVALAARHHRLPAGGRQVEDRKPPVPEGEAGFRSIQTPESIGPAVGKRGDHRLGDPAQAVRRMARAPRLKPGNPTHERPLSR